MLLQVILVILSVALILLLGHRAMPKSHGAVNLVLDPHKGFAHLLSPSLVRPDATVEYPDSFHQLPSPRMNVGEIHDVFSDVGSSVVDRSGHSLESGVLAGDALEWSICDKVVHANLGGLGPNFSAPEELRFKNVGLGFDNGPLDLVVTNVSEFVTDEPIKNGERFCFGRINVCRNTSVDLNFTFVHSGTSEPAPQPHFMLKFWDLDGSHPNGSTREILLVLPGAANFALHESSPLETIENQDGTLFKAPFGPILNVRNITEISLEQEKHSVELEYLNTAIVQVRLIAWSPFLTPGEGARNFFFQGNVLELSATTTTTTPCSEPADCIIWGDPHVIPFDLQSLRKRQHPIRESFLRSREWKSSQVNIVEEGTFWLVRSDAIHIQGKYVKSGSMRDKISLSSLVVGGPFLGKNSLVFRRIGEKTTWDGTEILPGNVLPGAFKNEYVSAYYHRGAELVKDGTRGLGVEVELPMGVRLSVNRWKTMLACKITLCAQHLWKHRQQGHCGNFNRESADDTLTMMNAGKRHLRVKPKDRLEFGSLQGSN